MGKAIAAILFIAAFFFALCLLLGRKRVPQERVAGANGWRKIFLLASLSILAFLTGCPGGKSGGNGKDTSPAAHEAQTAAAEAQVQPPAKGPEPAVAAPTAPEEPAASAPLGKLKGLWAEVVSYSVAEAWVDRDKEAARVHNLMKDHEARVKELVAAKQLDEETGKNLVEAYDGMMTHMLQLYAGPSCYDMTMEGQFVYEVKDASVKRIAELEKFVENGTLKPAAAEKIEASIARDLYFIRLIDEADDAASKGKWKEWNKKIKEIKAFYDDTKHVIAKTDPSFKLADVIVSILLGGKED